ncbi:phage tail tape measure protein [Uruburuella testudinis]|uniref:Phage tail tape measure protein n=1 Tax=Uruburuella testudinis TaxID=1282863 RepID=A0ABY4DUR4_9NEIS|nr:phage tail tape measure protein [Uruburuella testudinis]UOO82765.1 phage tail tape measure protein [Uruburuella testudinis]
MSADLAIGIKVGFGAGAAIGGLTSLRRSMHTLGSEVQKLSARQRLLGGVLENPLRMSKQRVGELKHEYVQLGVTIDKLRNKQAALGKVQLQRDHLKQQRGELLGQVAATASLATTAIVPVKLAVDFESTMADVKKVVDFDTPEQVKQMGDDILKLTRTIPMSADSLGQIAASGGQLGVARQDIIGFTEQIAKMSVAFDMSADQAGDSMAKLANVYKIPIAEIGKLGDAINELSNSSPAKAENIVNVLGRVGGVAKQFGLTEFQAASLGNAFIALGRTPEVAGTAINGMLTKLMTADKQGAKFQKVLKGMGTDAKTLKKSVAENGEQALVDFLKQVEKLPKDQQMGALVDLFGVEYADDVAALVGGLDTYEAAIKRLKDTNADGSLKFLGSMDKEFQARAETTAASWQTLKNHMAELAITVGSTLLPAVNSLLDFIKPMIAGLTDWARANPAATRSILGFVAGLALFKVSLLAGVFSLNIARTALSFFPAMMHKISATWLLSVLKFRSGTGLIFKSVGLVKSALGGLRAALPLIKAFGQGFVRGFVGLGKLAWLAMRGLGMGITRMIPIIGGAFAKLGLFLMANPIFIALGLLAAAAYMLYRNWDGVVGGAKLLWQDLGSFVGGIANTVSNFFSTAWENIKAFFSSGIGNISATIVNWSPLGLFYQAFAAVLSWFGITLPATFTGFGSMIIQGLWNGLKAKFEEVKGWFSGVAGWFGGAFQKANDIHSPSRLFRRFGGFMMEGLQIGLDAGTARPLAAISRVAQSVQRRFTQSSVLPAPDVPPLATPSFTPPALLPAPKLDLWERLGGYAAALRDTLAKRMQDASADFAAARQAEAGQQQAARQQAVIIHFNPTIHAPGGDPAQIQTALQMGLREFETLFHRMMADRERRAY